MTSLSSMAIQIRAVAKASSEKLWRFLSVRKKWWLLPALLLMGLLGSLILLTQNAPGPPFIYVY